MGDHNAPCNIGGQWCSEEGFYNESLKYFGDTRKLAPAASIHSVTCQLLSQFTTLMHTKLVVPSIKKVRFFVNLASMIVRQIQHVKFELFMLVNISSFGFAAFF